MRRLYVSLCEPNSGTIVLPDSEAYHVRSVLRAREGDAFRVHDGQGREFITSVSEVTRSRVDLRVTEEILHPRERCEIILLQGIVKRKAMDWVVEKATELGVAQILPVKCDRSVPEASMAGAKLERWRDLSISALKQCGCPWLPDIASPLSFAEALTAAGEFELNLVAGLSGEVRAFDEVIGERLPTLREGPVCIGIWIGPEGDFSPTEYELLEAAGYPFVSLGRNVLRADTAAITGIAQLSYELTRAGLRD